jgi:ribosomal protein S12 methylthiotransferase
MRAAMPQLAVRSTFIVGYPGETEAEFESLMQFVAEMRFDRVGAFQFSFEPGTSSETLGDPVPPEAKQERFHRLMTDQQSVSLQLNQAQVGRTLDVLIEGRDRALGIGRSYRDAPEIDGLVFVEGDADVGDIVTTRITGAMTYDLTARQVARSEGPGLIPIELATPGES